MPIPYPSLSLSGWAKSPEDVAYFLFADFYESQKNQTQTYGNNVSNLQWLVAEYGHDIPLFCQKLRETLTNYLNRYYDQVDIETAYESTAQNPGSLVKVTVSSTVYDNGVKYSFGHLVEKNGKVGKLLTLIADGTYV